MYRSTSNIASPFKNTSNRHMSFVFHAFQCNTIVQHRSESPNCRGIKKRLCGCFELNSDLGKKIKNIVCSTKLYTLKRNSFGCSMRSIEVNKIINKQYDDAFVQQKQMEIIIINNCFVAIYFFIRQFFPRILCKLHLSVYNN